MAEDEIVILEASDEESIAPIESINELLDADTQEQPPAPKKKPPTSKKKKLLIITLSGALIGALILVGVLLYFLSGSNETKPMDVNTTKLAKEIQKKEPEQPFAPSRLENMLKKANLLYEGGNKLEALKIYEDIAVYSEALSQYNIGVAQMKEKNFEGALASFKNAITNQEHRSISAINAAVCALELGKSDLFKYYIDLAYTYLPEESNSPLYSYYVGLVNYYKSYYYEALSSLMHPSSEFYQDRQNYLASKLLAYLGNDHLAINTILKENNINNALPLGLLYAKIGEYKIAQAKLEEAKSNAVDHQKATLALALVHIKLGNHQTAATLLRQAQLDYPDTVTDIYPIEVTLKKSLFDVNRAQEDFKKRLFFDKEKQYALLFYFAPYKVFNAKQTIDYIRKGSMNVFVDEIGSALQYLKTSSTISKVNIAISQGIKTALAYNIAKANKEFEAMIQAYPQHSILHYNLALTYAQLGNFSKAYKHFITSYHLNPKNYLAGTFAAMSADLIGKEFDKLLVDIKETLEHDTTQPKINLYITLIHLIENNQLSMARWMEEAKEKTPLNLTLDIITAKVVSNSREYLAKSRQLQSLLPKDVIANILAFHAQYGDQDIKSYAKAIQIEFRKFDLDMNAFYYGPNIVKEQYIKLLQIGGLLHHERKHLKERMEVEQNDVAGVMQTLAYLDLFTNHFEESYTLYNQLIDTYKQQDTHTVFLGAVASIGARHPENAIALLELSKLIDPTNLESRYGLGLLYQEVKNLESATIQFDKIGDNEFNSDYFSFRILPTP